MLRVGWRVVRVRHVTKGATSPNPVRCGGEARASASVGALVSHARTHNAWKASLMRPSM
jgi:hypothetical protein